MGKLNPQTTVLKVYLTKAELEKLKMIGEDSLCKSLSEYSRKILLRKPVHIGYRNRSADDAVEVNIKILEMLRTFQSHPSLTDAEKKGLIAGIERIEILTGKIFDLCSPKSSATGI